MLTGDYDPQAQLSQFIRLQAEQNQAKQNRPLPCGIGPANQIQPDTLWTALNRCKGISDAILTATNSLRQRVSSTPEKACDSTQGGSYDLKSAVVELENNLIRTINVLEVLNRELGA
jgi:hypothetical protein